MYIGFNYTSWIDDVIDRYVGARVHRGTIFLWVTGVLYRE